MKSWDRLLSLVVIDFFPLQVSEGSMLFLTSQFGNLGCYFTLKQYNNRLQQLASSRPPVNKSSVMQLTSAYYHVTFEITEHQVILYLLYNKRFGIKNKRLGKFGWNCMMLGSGYQYKPFVSWKLSVLHVLDFPFTWREINQILPKLVQNSLCLAQFYKIVSILQ